MATSFPFVLRIAAGVVSDTVDAIRRLPAELPNVGVSLVGRAAKLTFTLNQELSELAIRGDQALSMLSGSDKAPPERTAWSTIDDEDEVAAADPQSAAHWDSVAVALADAIGADDADSPDAIDLIATGPNPAAPKTTAPKTTAPKTTAPKTTAPKTTAPKTTPRKSAAATTSAAATRKKPAAAKTLGDASAVLDGEPAVRLSGIQTATGVDAATLPLAGLKAELKAMAADDVASLLAFEHGHKARPAFLTLLTNRLATLANS
ncbi:lipid droplet-associated protein [Nakamurella antarctica]|uniref:Lipid droplet-associated protein n=1 Tax=Nakamurella antarctica TaxID=1902245 RepID=A0A3G8ZJN7_9ACTN|nr:lipid droplet-associated protein [Nakamurella antarctica]AZI57398.1 lipid droplet-associated protein [Nakamurella antarctica]